MDCAERDRAFGINRILVPSLDEHGGERAHQSIDVSTTPAVNPHRQRVPRPSTSRRCGGCATVHHRSQGNSIVPTGAILQSKPEPRSISTELVVARARKAGGGWIGLSSHPLYAHLVPPPVGVASHFQNSAQENQLLFCDMDYAEAAEQSIRLDNSTLLIDHMTWSGLRKQFLS